MKSMHKWVAATSNSQKIKIKQALAVDNSSAI